MKRSGFTMIELIFVIVILGILAAVAIPKLAATRTDAEVTNVKAVVAQAQSAVPAQFTSQRIASFDGAMTLDTAATGTEGAFSFDGASECAVTYTENAANTIQLAIQQDAGAPTNNCTATDVANALDDNMSILITFTFNASDGVVGQVAGMFNKGNGETIRIPLGGQRVTR